MHTRARVRVCDTDYTTARTFLHIYVYVYIRESGISHFYISNSAGAYTHARTYARDAVCVRSKKKEREESDYGEFKYRACACVCMYVLYINMKIFSQDIYLYSERRGYVCKSATFVFEKDF